MTLFGLLSVWVLVFGIVHSEMPLESDVDVKNLLQRLVVLEESFEVERQRNDELEKTVNILTTNLEQTKRTFEDKCAALEKQLQNHREERTKISAKNVAEKTQRRRTYKNNWQKKPVVDWWTPLDSSSKSKNRDSDALSIQRRDSTNLKKRLLVQPSQVPPTPVAFYAQRSTSIPENEVTANLVIVFDVVKTNAGNGYHPSTGVFIVPESGIYVFSWSFRNSDNHSHSTELMVNNNEEGLIYSRTAGSSISTTGVAVLHVNKGDDVYIRVSSLRHTGTIYSDVLGRCVFTGWKLA
ncbi:uncharacterized protein LOC111137974 [Crassostrea virginica]